MDVPSRGGEYSPRAVRINRVRKIIEEFRIFGEFGVIGKLFAGCNYPREHHQTSNLIAIMPIITDDLQNYLPKRRVQLRGGQFTATKFHRWLGGSY
jgi:hypothetical protein